MRRDHPISPFDFEDDERQHELQDVTEQFWGTTRGWVSKEHPTTEPTRQTGRQGALTTGSMAAIKSGLAAFRPTVRADASGEIARTRQHGVTRPQAVASREATLGELASGWLDDDDDWSLPTSATPAIDAADRPLDDDHLIPLADGSTVGRTIGIGAVDPLLVRVGAIVAAIVLLVPLALSLRPAPADAVQSVPGVAAPVGAAPAAGPSVAGEAEAPGASGESPSSASDTESGDESTSSVGGGTSAQAAAAVESPPVTPAPASEPEADSTVEPMAEAALRAAAQSEVTDDAATVDAVAERQVPECPQTYEAGTGDSWYRIADAAGVTPSELLDENRALLETVIFPGDEICLPAGATMPSQPTTIAPATTAPATTAPATTAPATTAPATTTPASTSEVQQIIRDVFPDELEERALEIAFRESRYVATAYNGWCCYGVFQIYWSVHQGWLDDYGIYTASDLYDARKNTEAAYALYRSAGGWGPWGG